MTEEKKTIKNRYAGWKTSQGKQGRIGMALFIIINAVAFTSGLTWAYLAMILVDGLFVWKLYGKQIRAYRAQQKALKIAKAKAFLKKEGVNKL